MRVQTVFMLDDLAIKLVRQSVDRSTEIRVFALDEDILAGNVTGDFGFLGEVVPGEDHVDVDDVIEMPADSGEFALHVVAERWRDRHVMSAYREIHARAPVPESVLFRFSPSEGASKSFSHADRGDLQGLTVLGDGAAGDHYALLAENVGYSAVRKGFSSVLGCDQLLELLPEKPAESLDLILPELA